jgi:hypothetical protein
VPSRRFPPPWSVEETDACFIVKEARRIAANIAKLPWAKIDGAPNGSR